ncbi:M10 family metallopeptidase [Leisingera sp. ANG-Vp]|uniref:M10 family metallopeptidase n=1 Tax=Leisingera sp. ANG-Vp TaxID=1577896 RepID=UPI000690D7FC|nr:M10 family metallopeptidase [Leisingera sp. ANG-Vp]
MAAAGTLDQMADYLTDGYWQDNSDLGHSFDTSSSNQITVNLTGLTADGQEMARRAMASWEMVADIKFVETTSAAQITFTDDQPGAYAHATYSTNGNTQSATVNISTDWLAQYGTEIDGYGQQTYMHELGHALGLGHQGDYNGGATYGVDETFSNDSWQLSVMSYFDQVENTSVSADFGFVLTPMMVDVIAIQNLYGAPGGSGGTAGNTIWGLNSNLTGPLGTYFDAWSNLGAPHNDVAWKKFAFTIYDQGGNDTLDVSPWSQDARIDMEDTKFSDVGGLTGNIGIARGTVLENVITGAGNDVITGNQANNSLEGRDGDDSLYGGAGSDTLRGGNGNDRLEGNDGADTLYGHGGHDTLRGGGSGDVLGGGFGNDYVRGDGGSDSLTGGNGNDTLTGNSGADTLDGGANQDTLFGGNGNDVLDGGGNADKLDGGDGDDIYWVNHSGDTVIEDAGEGTDTVNSSVSFDLSAHGDHIENLVLTGTGDLDGTGNTASNVITGNDGSNSLTGNAGNDTLNAGEGDDILSGGSGADRLVGNQGNDSLSGGTGGDTLVAGNGNDTLIGFNQNDALYGGNGNDSLKGGSGNDTLFGGNNNDFLTGGFGDDAMTGGSGADTFEFKLNHDTATITDFGTGSDTLLLGGFGLSSEADALSNASQAGSDVVFDFGGGDILTLEDLQLQDLTGNITIL